MLISVAAPRFWWRLAPAEVRRWVSADPDVEDGQQRHADRDEQHWDAIASVVAQVGDALASGAWSTDDEFDACGFVTIDACPGDLTQAEQKIVASWFSSSEAVQVDPWFDRSFNGRHRLWATARRFGAGLVPICGNELGYANAADLEGRGSRWPELYVKYVEDLDALDWFNGADPLNASFRTSLVTAASGQFPSPVETVQPTSGSSGASRARGLDQHG